MHRDLLSTESMPRKRTSSVLDDDFFAEWVEEDRKPAKKARKPSKPKKAGKDIGTCSLTKKDIGDYVKSASKLEKYVRWIVSSAIF